MSTKEVMYIRGTGKTPLDPKIEVYMPWKYYNAISPEAREANYACAIEAAWMHGGFTNIRIRAFSHNTGYAMDIQGRRIAWGEYVRGRDAHEDWIVVPHDPHITALFWHRDIPDEVHNVHIYVVEDKGIPKLLMSPEQRAHPKWNDVESPQLWSTIREEQPLTDEDVVVEYMDTSDDSGASPSKPVPAVEDWKLALAAKFADVHDDSLGGPRDTMRLVHFLRQQRSGDKNYKPNFKKAKEDFIAFVEAQDKTSRASAHDVE